MSVKEIIIMKYLTFIFLLTGFSVQGQENHRDKTIIDNFVGTWSLIAVDNIYPDGKRTHPYGENPVGLLIFDHNGNYAIQIYKAVRPKVSGNDKNNATPDENAAIVQGSNSHFGKYTIDEKNNLITFIIEYASYPNWEGTEQKRTFSLSDNVLKYIVTNTTQGGSSVTAEVSWKKR